VRTASILRLHSRRYTAAQHRNGRRAAVARTVAVRTVSCGSVYNVARPAGIRTRAYKSATDRDRWAAPVDATAQTGLTPPAAARVCGAGCLVRAALLLSAAAPARPRLPPYLAGRRCHPPWCSPPVRCAVHWGMADVGDSAPGRHGAAAPRMRHGQATHPGVWGFVRQGPTPRVSDAAGFRGHARARLNDAMRVGAPPSVARYRQRQRLTGGCDRRQRARRWGHRWRRRRTGRSRDHQNRCRGRSRRRHSHLCDWRRPRGSASSGGGGRPRHYPT